MLYNGGVKKWWGIALGVIVIITAYFCYATLRPLPAANTSIDLPTIVAGGLTADDLGLNRAAIGYVNPDDGQIVCRALGEGEAYDVAQPTASIAKLITVQVVLNKHPLDATEQGPSITMSADDEARYWWTVNIGGSSVRVVAGEQISERQLIEGILLASGNNMADTLAIWAFGSIDNYLSAAREWLAEHNLTSTTVGGDASGFSPETKSTPADLCHIILLASQQPALANIMAETEATMPTGDTITSTNRLLGQYGVFAGKTGYTEEAGRGVVIASQQTINDTSLTVGVVSLSNDSYDAAFDTARQLLEAMPNDLHVYQLSTNDAIGAITSAWGSRSNITVNHGITIPYWSDQPPQLSAQLFNNADASGLSPNSLIGYLSVNGQQVSLTAKDGLSTPSLPWRLTHPFTN